MPVRAKSPKSQRRLGFQSLEKRQLLAAHISELLVDPLFGSNDTEQYIELRGEPNETLAAGSYLVVVSERRPNAGEIHGIFDLSGQSFGSNGYLTILQKDHPFDVHPDSNVLVSSEEAFGGLPGGIYTDSHTLSDRIDFIIGANAYMLIQTDTPPELKQNIDLNEDGVIDESIQQSWNVMDSISLHPFVGRGDFAFGEIVFAEIGTGPGDIQVGEGVELIHTEGFGYAGRVGESIGHREADWVASTPQNENLHTENPPKWALADNLFGEPSQYPFAGRDLDHLGEANFVGGVRGTVILDASGQPTADVTVLADLNGNGIRDSLTYVVNPDDVVDHENPLDEDGKEKKYPLINAYPGVTITNFALDSFPAHEVTAEKERDFPNTLENRIFAKGGIDWFTKSGVLRFDFYRPVNAVSVVAIGSDSLSDTFGRIDAFNADGELIASDVSSLLVDSDRETISVEVGTDSIAYAFAYSDQEHEGGIGGPFGRFDHMVYSQLEPAAVTDENGYYEIQHLFPGRYEVSVLADQLVSDKRVVEIEKYENFVHDFSLAPNQAPTIESANFEIVENSEPGTVVGAVSATDVDGQELTFAIVGEQSEFTIDAVTGIVSVADEAVLDFESTSDFTFAVQVTDPSGADAAANVTVSLLDVNEAPESEFGLFRIPESTQVGAEVGTIDASDPDTSAAQALIFEIIGGSGASDFVVNAQTGVITLAQAQSVTQDVEKTLEIRVTDTGVPALSTIASAVVLIEDENGAPDVESSTFTINESAAGGDVIGTVIANDDPEQTLTYSLVESSERFAIDSQTGVLTVKQGAEFDFETQNEFGLVVQVTDDGSPQQSATAEQIIRVEDVNDPPVIGDSELTVEESAAFGATIGFVEGEDPDAESTLQYQVVGGTGQTLFTLHPETGRVSVNTEDLDFEITSEYTLEVEVSDNGDPALKATANVLITVVDVNEAPVVTTQQIQAEENSTGELGRLEAEDPDQGQTHTFELIGGSAQDVVTVAADGTVTLREDATLDYEAVQSYNLEVRVTDNGDPAASTVAQIPLIITDQDEAPVFQADLAPADAMSGERFEYAIDDTMIVDPEGHEFSVEATVPGEALPEWLTFDPIEWVFRGIPSSLFAGDLDITVRAFQTETPEVESSITLQLTIGVSETPLHNVETPHDVNGDERVSASDALRIINFISRNDSQQRIDASVRLPAFFDVTGDNFVTSLDALQVINEMRRSSLQVSGEAVASIASDDSDKDQDEALAAYLAESALF